MGAINTPGHEVKVPYSFHNMNRSTFKHKFYYAFRWLYLTSSDKDKWEAIRKKTQISFQDNCLRLVYNAEELPKFLVGAKVTSPFVEDMDQTMNSLEKEAPDIYKLVREKRYMEGWPDPLISYLGKSVKGEVHYVYADFNEGQRKMLETVQKDLRTHSVIFLRKDLLKLEHVGGPIVQEEKVNIDDIGEMPPL